MTEEVCPPGEIRGRTGFLVWGVPILAVVAGNVWPSLFLWLGIPAFLVMGGACAWNAASCGRLHCYGTAPFLLGMAALLILVALDVAPAAWVDEAGIVVIGGVVLAFGAEKVSGRRYMRRG